MDPTDTRPGRRRGRPPKAHIEGEPSTSTMAIRVRLPMRRAMEEEAAATGLSLSEVGEKWLLRGQFGLPSPEELPVLREVEAVLDQLTDFAGKVAQNIGDPRREERAQAALAAGIRVLLEARTFRKSVTKEQETRLQARIALQVVAESLHKLATQTGHPPLDLHEPIELAARGDLRPEVLEALRDMPPLGDEFPEETVNDAKDLVDRIKVLEAADDAARDARIAGSDLGRSWARSIVERSEGGSFFDWSEG